MPRNRPKLRMQKSLPLAVSPFKRTLTAANSYYTFSLGSPRENAITASGVTAHCSLRCDRADEAG